MVQSKRTIDPFLTLLLQLCIAVIHHTVGAAINIACHQGVQRESGAIKTIELRLLIKHFARKSTHLSLLLSTTETAAGPDAKVKQQLTHMSAALLPMLHILLLALPLR